MNDEITNSCKAPLFAVKNSVKGGFDVVRGSCHKWTCGRCGHGVAQGHYGRIVEGARQLSEREENLHFLTITCRGGDLSRKEAERDYLKWTNAVLTAMRQHAKKHNIAWYYVQVTEYQKREIPHSHLLTTFCPDDVTRGYRKHGKTGETEKVLRSAWLKKSLVGAGLGHQYDISLVRDIEAASRYVAKYMFKDSMFSAEYPQKWKRVRYSQSWPKFERDANGDAIVLVTLDDWQKLACLAVVVRPDSEDTRLICKTNLLGSGVFVM